MSVASEQEQERLDAWRDDYAERLGFDVEQRVQIVALDLDVHALEDLVSRGCPRALAIEILLP